ncbi:efflux RND transporter periplasmic adaptor subunit [Phaeodactylibacter luteus]|uniref:Efflux RND transporter periplasmic adaptor subunit n=2 Tax=Phaeodactylibacter luteus TaxID=1564516 RepID=A0A5C6S331_9BACT|nr:efflux RND transporter periplasmic adaptor subunit [Phaeodactylibacter luteus]
MPLWCCTGFWLSTLSAFLVPLQVLFGILPNADSHFLYLPALASGRSTINLNQMNFKYGLLCLAAACFLASCQHSESPTAHDSHGEKEHHSASHSGGHHTGVLEVTRPIQQDTLYYNEYVSQIQAFHHIELKALEKGYLQKVLVDEGQVVQKGQLLFEIQPTIYLAEIQKAQAELAQAEAEREKARVEYDNIKALADSNIVSVNELALARAELQKAAANVDNAKAEVSLMEAHFQFTQIRAPFSGIVGRFEDIRLGSLLDEGEELTTLTDNSQMWVYFNVPETVYLNYAEHPSDASSLMLRLANGKLFDYKGKVTAVEAEFDNTTGTIPFRATFHNPGRLLRHGQTGNILWPVQLAQAMLIPQKAVYEVLDKRFVFVVGAEGRVASREIQIAAELDNLYVVSEGLGLEDQFLLEGLRKVKNGDQIEYEYKAPEEVYSQLGLHAE